MTRDRRLAPRAAGVVGVALAILVSTPIVASAQARRGGGRGVIVGPVVELNFRGERGEDAGGAAFKFANGPSYGLRLNVWLTDVLGIAAQGSYARTEYCLTETVGACFPGDVVLWRALGEFLVRVKPGVPGYFLLGGGATFVSPDEDVTGAFQGPTQTEFTLTGGAALDLRTGRRTGVRLELRTYLIAPENQPPLDVNATQLDFAVGLGFAYRL